MELIKQCLDNEILIFCNDSKFEWGLTLLWSFCTQLFHQGSTRVLELGSHKDREKLCSSVRPHSNLESLLQMLLNDNN